MIYITEEQSAAIVSHELAYEAARDALIAVAGENAATFPVVIGHGSERSNRFTIKSASDGSLAGLKVGSYFATNDLVGLPRHSSIILLFDQARGRIGAIVEGSKVNAYRTAAADAVATNRLARADARILAIFGTGHQAFYEVEAISRIRTLDKVLVVGRSPQKASAFCDRLRNAGLPAEIATAQAACRQADIVIAATTATSALFEAGWIKAGTHISSMGSDGAGKQELPPEIYARSALFCDLPEQSRRIGEFQHAPSDVPVVAIGDVLCGRHAGRTDDGSITVFDSSGVSIQDLYIAQRIIKAHQDRNPA